MKILDFLSEKFSDLLEWIDCYKKLVVYFFISVAVIGVVSLISKEVMWVMAGLIGMALVSLVLWKLAPLAIDLIKALLKTFVYVFIGSLILNIILLITMTIVSSVLIKLDVDQVNMIGFKVVRTTKKDYTMVYPIRPVDEKPFHFERNPIYDKLP